MKKSIVISLLTVTTLFCTALCSFASTGIVTTDTLRLRKEASTDSSTLALLSINDKVEILSEENGWYKVKSKEHVGYVAAQYINVLTEANKNEDNNSQNVENPSTNAQLEENNQNTNEQQENQNNENMDKKDVETITVLVSGEKIYITPIINSLVIETIKDEEKQIEIVSEINGWSYIKIGTTTGWVRTENIKNKEVEKNTSNPENDNNNDNNNNNNTNSSPKIGYISGTSVNFRKTPNTSGEVIKKLSRNAKITILEKGDTWTKIEYNGDTGYISNEYISDKEVETTSRSATSRTANSSNDKSQETKKTSNKSEIKSPNRTGAVTGSDVINYAKQFLGYKYTSGGSTPSRGFDCSGFTTYIYKQFGISLSRTSSGQSSNGVEVSKSNLAVGDIICFSSSSSSKKIGHVGIYVGGGKFIHAANSRKGVIISNVSGAGYYFVTARRVI